MRPGTRKLLFLQKNFLDPEFAKESFDMVLAAASLEFYVSLFFIGDSVFQLIDAAENPLSGLLKALPVYDIQKIYVMQESLHQRQLSPENLLLPVVCLLPQEVSAVINEYDSMVG